MSKLRYKLTNPRYSNMGKLRHKGKIGFGTGECITTHIANILDTENCYKEVNGKVHVRSLRIKARINDNGEKRLIEDSGKFVPLSKHFETHGQKIINPMEV